MCFRELIHYNNRERVGKKQNPFRKTRTALSNITEISGNSISNLQLIRENPIKTMKVMRKSLR